jgi:hypothetical protein
MAPLPTSNNYIPQRPPSSSSSSYTPATTTNNNVLYYQVSSDLDSLPSNTLHNTNNLFFDRSNRANLIQDEYNDRDDYYHHHPPSWSQRLEQSCLIHLGPWLTKLGVADPRKYINAALFPLYIIALLFIVVIGLFIAYHDKVLPALSMLVEYLRSQGLK